MTDRGEGHQALRVFVAMPGTDMGKNAKYRNPESVKKNLLEPVVQKLQSELGRSVELHIEKDKLQSGVIHESMFGEAWNSDVYIADLTGANPNVYLELGVRWALRDYVTVLIAQSTEDLKFNVNANRVLIYHPDNLIQAIGNIVTTIQKGLENKKCDSPVRLNSDLLEVQKRSLEQLESELAQLKQMRGNDLLAGARATQNLADRIKLLKQATEANPALAEAWLELGRSYRLIGDYTDAVEALQKAKELSPGNAIPLRELGVAYSKQGNAELAAQAIRDAVRIDPNNYEAWSNLGGALRRLGMTGTPNKNILLEARNSYATANRLKKNNLYAALNVARLDVLLSRWEPERLHQAKEGFQKLLHLSRHEAQNNSENAWAKFDLADALLFSGEYKEAHDVLRSAIKQVSEDARKDTLSSVLSPLQSYLDANVLQGDLLAEAKLMFDEIETARGIA